MFAYRNFVCMLSWMQWFGQFNSRKFLEWKKKYNWIECHWSDNMHSFIHIEPHLVIEFKRKRIDRFNGVCCLWMSCAIVLIFYAHFFFLLPFFDFSFCFASWWNDYYNCKHKIKRKKNRRKETKKIKIASHFMRSNRLLFSFLFLFHSRFIRRAIF